MSSLLLGQIKYGAVYAKILALYSNMLKKSDYLSLANCSSVSEVADILSQNPAYLPLFEKRDISKLHRSDIENILKTAYKNDYKRFYKYIDKEDIAFIEMHETNEIFSEIIRFLHLFNEGKQRNYFPMLPEEFIADSKIEFDKLSGITDYDEFIELASKSEYAGLLKAAAPKGGGGVNIPKTDTGLFTGYYQTLIKKSMENKNKTAADKYIKYLRDSIEIINAVRILRIKLFYPEYSSDIDDVMINSREIKSKVANEKFSSMNFEEALSNLKSGKYGKYLKDINENNLDNAIPYFTYMLSKRLLHIPEPSVYTVIAYLNLKSIEIRNIINVTEGVRYSLPQEKITDFIIA